MADTQEPRAPGAGRPATAGPRLLLNAEPFGFGPAAAVALLAAELAPDCGRIAYIGEGHTLDLQSRPPYHAIHDTTGLTEDERLARLRKLAPRYDLFVTAMDSGMAALARRAGMGLAIYDALTWYWPALPAVAYEADPYIAQDFFGVRERVAADAALRERAVVVPPVIPPGRDWTAGRHVLVNLGGLDNPLWRPYDAVAYARLMLAAVRAGLPAGRPVVAVTNRGIAAALADPAVGTYDHGTMLELMSTAAYACMTSGLGNIYDAATTGVPTLWLPGANDSHTRQVRLLSEHGYCDAHLDWEDIGLPVVDHTAPPAVVMREISGAVRRLAGEQRLRERLAEELAGLTAGLGRTPGKARALTDRFGHGGMRLAAA
ncbi:hypothetical protein, partial [Streptomyces sp. NPDC050804]|uniref:hypothetical protein n=1 Tax=Streptomyces sp. NPDC050804 TaxID=3154745 RepID=UPI00342CC610